VIGVGPGFTAGLDCHAVVKQNAVMAGPVLLEGSAAPDTGIRERGGYTKERVLRTPRAGVFHPCSPSGRA
jgi:xanthine dehydrogenase accessory factor